MLVQNQTEKKFKSSRSNESDDNRKKRTIVSLMQLKIKAFDKNHQHSNIQEIFQPNKLKILLTFHP